MKDTKRHARKGYEESHSLNTARQLTANYQIIHEFIGCVLAKGSVLVQVIVTVMS